MRPVEIEQSRSDADLIAELRKVETNLTNTLTNLDAPIDEIDALACLLGIARKVKPDDRYGYDVEFLDDIILRRIRALARRCQNEMARWNTPFPDLDGPIELIEKDEDQAPIC